MASDMSSKKLSYSDTFEMSSSISSSERLDESSTHKEDGTQSQTPISESRRTTSEKSSQSACDSDTSVNNNSRIPSSYSLTKSWTGTHLDKSASNKEEISATTLDDRSESYTRCENTASDGDSSFSDTQSYRSELSFVDDSQDTTSDQYSYSETFDPETFDTPVTHSAATYSARARTLETLKEESDYDESVYDESQSLWKKEVHSFDRSVETRSSYEDTFEPSDSYTYSFRLRTEDIREISEAELNAADALEEKEEFINRMCERLKKKKMDVPKDPPKKKVHEDPVLTSYCKKKIKQLHSGVTQKKDLMHEVEQGVRKKKMATHRVPIETYGLNSAIVDRLKLMNIMEHMKKLSQMEIHDVKKCKKCRKQQQMLDEEKHQRLFVEHYSRRLQSENMDEKVQQHLINMTSINLIGQIVSERPDHNLCSFDILDEYKRRILKRKKQE